MEVEAEVRLVSGSGVTSLGTATLWADFGFKILCARAAPLCRVPGAQGDRAPRLPGCQLPEL